MLVCSMHPTVLHEDSTLVSGDFPGMARQFLQENLLGPDCPVLHHTGPCGNQSPRHITRANTFGEAKRLGQLLGQAVIKTIPEIRFQQSVELECLQEHVDLPRRRFPSVAEAERDLKRTIAALDLLRQSEASRQQIRTAECDCFGAEELLTLARAAREGKLDGACNWCLPAEVQIIKIGSSNFVGWPGEIFVEYSLEVKSKCDNTFIISLANGELQGYIVTEAAAEEGGYEASNAFFEPRSGQILVEKTLQMLNCFQS
jgi:hypothetical protein